MIDVIYLVLNATGVDRMTKRMPGSLHRGEIAVKVNVEIPRAIFQPPTVERSIQVTDWRDGTELGDVEFRQSFITEEEAELIRQRRLAKMKDILEGQGYTVTAECAHGDGCLLHPGGTGCDG